MSIYTDRYISRNPRPDLQVAASAFDKEPGLVGLYASDGAEVRFLVLLAFGHGQRGMEVVVAGVRTRPTCTVLYYSIRVTTMYAYRECASSAIPKATRQEKTLAVLNHEQFLARSPR